MPTNPTQVEPVEGLVDDAKIDALFDALDNCILPAVFGPGTGCVSISRPAALSGEAYDLLRAALRSSTVNDELVEALREMVESCGITPSIHDGCGTTIITAPSAATFAKARAALAKLETPDAGKERGE